MLVITGRLCLTDEEEVSLGRGLYPRPLVLVCPPNARLKLTMLSAVDKAEEGFHRLEWEWSLCRDLWARVAMDTSLELNSW